MLRMGVPVATPVEFKDLSAGFKALCVPNGVVESFSEQVRLFTKASQVYAVNSGRASLYITFRVLAGQSERKNIIIPAFICPSVAKAIVKAGLNVILCDIRGDDFGIDPDALEKLLTFNPLAVVATHLFGYPSDLSAIIKIASRNGIVVVEDAAQSFGAEWNSQPVGALTSVSIFSFGMSKALSTMGGGLIAVNDKILAENFGAFFDGLPHPGRGSQLVGLSKIAALSVLSRSQHLGPLMYIWKKYFQRSSDLDDFDLARYSSAQAAIAVRLMERFKEIIDSRRTIALQLEKGLRGLPGISVPQIPPESSPVYLRFPVVVEDVTVREQLVKRLSQNGINVSQMYDMRSFEAVRCVASSRSRYPVTEYLCRRMVNLPTHAYLTERDISTMIETFHRVLS